MLTPKRTQKKLMRKRGKKSIIVVAVVTQKLRQSRKLPKKKELSKGKCVEAASSDAARIKELEEKVLHLEIENAFLKELRRLRLEEEMKRSQESSAVSEENTD